MSNQEIRTKNYIKYYREVSPHPEFSIEALQVFDIPQLMELLPPNQCVDEFNDKLKVHITKYIAGLQLHKTIDGSWNIGYYGITNDDTLIEFSYVKDLKLGLIHLMLWIQNRRDLFLKDVEVGNIILSLGETWDKVPEC